MVVAQCNSRVKVIPMVLSKIWIVRVLFITATDQRDAGVREMPYLPAVSAMRECWLMDVMKRKQKIGDAKAVEVLMWKIYSSGWSREAQSGELCG